MSDQQGLDEDDLVRKTDLLIQQLAAARATCGVPDSLGTTTAAGSAAAKPTAAESSAIAIEHAGGGYSIPSEVTFGGGGDGEEEISHAAASQGSKGGGATLSTASTSWNIGDEGDDDDDDESSPSQRASDSGSDVNNYQDAVPEVQPASCLVDEPHIITSSSMREKTPPPLPPATAIAAAEHTGTSLKKKIMSKYGEANKSPVASKNKKKGSSSSRASKKENRSSDKSSRSVGRAGGSGTSYAQQQQQQQQEYGADYSASAASPIPPVATRPAAQVPSTTPSQSFPSSYQMTTDESLQEAMRQAEIAEDAARRMREAVATHHGQTMDRGGGGVGIQGFGPDHPQGFGGSSTGDASSGPRVGASFLETGATACIRELFRCLADPLEALAGDNSAPPGTSVTGFGSMNDPHPRFARARGTYEYVSVPNIRHVFGGGDAPTGSSSRGEGGYNDRDRQNDESSERKGLLNSGTGYDSNW